MAITFRPDQAEQAAASRVVPQPGAVPSAGPDDWTSTLCQNGGPRSVTWQLRAWPLPLDRNHRPPLPPAPAAPKAPFEVEQLRRGFQPHPQQRLRRQQCDMMAGGAIGLDQVAPPYMPSMASEAAVLTPTKGHANVVRRCSRAWGPQSDATGHLCRAEGFDAQNLDDPLWPIGSPVSLCAIR